LRFELNGVIYWEFAVFLAFFPMRYIALAKRLTGAHPAQTFTPAESPVTSIAQPTAISNDQDCEIERSGLTFAQAEEWLDWLENNSNSSRAIKWRREASFAAHNK
jgi:hypothetical protein